MSRQTAMPGSGYRHNRQPRSQQQMDLFGSGLSNGSIGAPAWPEMPAEARAAIKSLMPQLFLDAGAKRDSLRASILSQSGVAQSREWCVAICHAGSAHGARVVRD